MKIKLFNFWLALMLAFTPWLDAQQALSRVDERSETPIEASVDKPKNQGPDNSSEEKTSKTGTYALSAKGADKIYVVNGFSLSYAKERDDLPAIEHLADIEVLLSLNKGIYTRPDETGSKPLNANLASEETALTLIQIGDIPQVSRFSAGALQEVLTSIVDYLNALDYYGVYANFDDDSIDPSTGIDMRKNKLTDLKIIIWTSEVVEVRTIGKGSRFPREASIDNEKHAKMLRHSPLSAATENYPGSLLSKDEMEDYLQRLSRHPGRQVDVAISSSDEPGEVVLDFLVNENKPYTLYAQVSNTGTKSTGSWRERVGFIHNQFTNNDDKFVLDYITAEFDQTNSVLSSYEIPILYPNYLKVRTYGSWSEYDGDAVGLSSSEFSGETTTLGLELVSTPFVFNGFNFDIMAGLRWSDIEIVNRSTSLNGGTPVWVPYLGVAMDRRNHFGSVKAILKFESNLGGVSKNQLSGSLGRGNLDANWQLFKGYFQSSLFLEPLIFGADWADRSSWQSSTLAHELDFKLGFQRTLDSDRIIPQQTFIAGGFSSVRGYNESVASGDSGLNMSLEYRYHMPRSLKPSSKIKDADNASGHSSGFLSDFNTRPPYVYGLPDWDMILRSFVDYGYTKINKGNAGEDNLTLASAGLGVELQMLSNLNIRLDWGVVLNTLKRSSIEVDEAAAGDSRFHFITTLSW